DVLWASAAVARARKRPDEARRYLETGAQLYPSRIGFYTSMAELETQSGNVQEGISWLRHGLSESPENSELLWALTELLIQTPDGHKEASTNIERMQKASSNGPLVEYLQARLSVAEEKWHEASQTLERLHPQLAKLPEFAKRADLLLAECYEQLGDADQQYT